MKNANKSYNLKNFVNFLTNLKQMNNKRTSVILYVLVTSVRSFCTILFTNNNIKVLFQRHTFLIDLQIVCPFAYRNICLEETLELPVFPGTAHIFVFLFVFGVSIILMNLLVGLAVSDIQEYYISNIICEKTFEALLFRDVNKTNTTHIRNLFLTRVSRKNNKVNLSSFVLSFLFFVLSDFFCI